MKKLPLTSRRDFIKFLTLATVGGSPFVNLAKSLSNSAFNPPKENDLEIFIFSKHLQFLDYGDMCEVTKEMGFDGIDLTVRPNGHVLPEKVIDDLPRATEEMNKYGLIPKMLTTNVLDADNKIDKKVLQTASEQGYNFYRTGWYKYSKVADIEESLLEYKNKLLELSTLNKKLNISGSYQNHSGHYMGASIWDLNNALDGLWPGYMGCQYDIMHANVEGGKNWEIDFRLIKDHINTIVVKDFNWVKIDNKWKTVNKQLGEGMVDFHKYFTILKNNNINVPLSIHCEYDLGGAERGGNPNIDPKEIFRKLRKDLLFVRKVWEEVR